MSEETENTIYRRVRNSFSNLTDLEVLAFTMVIQQEIIWHEEIKLSIKNKRKIDSITDYKLLIQKLNETSGE